MPFGAAFISLLRKIIYNTEVLLRLQRHLHFVLDLKNKTKQNSQKHMISNIKWTFLITTSLDENQ